MLVRAAAVLALWSVANVGAQELPVRTWNVRDGLVQSRVNDIHRDSNGFVWFATWDGVSRFDGVQFTNFSTHEGLPNPLVWCVAEAPDHVLWLGTHGGGLARIADVGQAVVTEPEGESNPARRVFGIAFDGDGRMWIVTERGVFTAERAGQEALHFEHLDELGAEWFGRMLVDKDGRMLLVNQHEFVRCSGRVLRRTTLATAGDLGDVRAFALRRTGGAFVAYVRSLHVLEWSDTDAVVRLRPFELKVGANTSLYDVGEDDSGRLWVATSTGLVAVTEDEAHVYSARDGLPDDWIHSLDRDPEGGLWFGTHQGGAAFLPDAGGAHYTRRSGLGDGHAVKLVSIDAEPRLVTTEVSGLFVLGNGEAELVAGSDQPPFDRIQSHIVRDASGEWWIGASDGVYHVRGDRPDLEHAHRLDDGNSHPGGEKSVIGLDPMGRAVLAGMNGELFTVDAGARIQAMPFAAPAGPVRNIVWLPDGTAWCSNGLALWRARGASITEYEPWRGSRSDSQPRALRADSRGWLWVGTRFDGLAFTRDPTAEHPSFERVTTKGGLASDTVFAIAEDRNGNMYFGTGRGVQRYSIREKTLETIGADDGLAGEWINDLVFDTRGDLWVAAANGVSRVRPDPVRVWRAPPRVRFMHCVVAGAEIALPAEGTFDPPAIEVAARDSRLEFEFTAVDPMRGSRLLYETRLEPLEISWSGARPERAVRYGGLGAGDYRLAVRCVDPNASEPGQATYVSIAVMPPLWAQGWFIASAAAVVLVIGFALHRLKLRRELALERMRTQIASDLHDDIGARLAQIAISSEIARRTTSVAARGALAEIAEMARGARASMSDIVWAVDPRHDTIAGVVARMRQFANDLFARGTTTMAMDVPVDAEIQGVVVAPDRKRNLLLFFKEALTNVARHARAGRVDIELEVGAGRLRLAIRDDGVGFDKDARAMGNGLANLERRARELGGELEIESASGQGTRILLEAPIKGKTA
ncbi:MAG: two-component regulator propeller domain-containing protein [Planctomycetota bacterium]